MKALVLAALAVIGSNLVWRGCGHQGQEHARYYSNEWLVRLEGGPEVGELIAIQMGYKMAGEVIGFRDTYRMIKEDHPRQRKKGQPSLTERLEKDSRVLWAEQQFSKQRQKRGFLPDLQDLAASSGLFLAGTGNRSRDRDDGSPVSPPERFRFNDELWDRQWYLQDTRTPKLDLHVLPCYDLGITGRGVRVSILDDGLEFTHSDLQDNYDPEISYDINDDDPIPLPRYDGRMSNAHGTRCAGEVAMAADNGKCGVGVAYNARIGAVRLLDGLVDDGVEGAALGYAHDKVDIYSVSWGPNDDGKRVEGPGRLALEAIERSIKEGRNGLGVIYVWAAGNGGNKGDNCECDGYTNSIYTLSIGSASHRGKFPWYGEKCASMLATTYSSGSYADRRIVTTDLGDKCTLEHTGTSASAPLAAGIIALALEVNPGLTWRDLQHLVVLTSDHEPLRDNEGWVLNAAGFWVNTRFGFGLMNAFRLVEEAAGWRNVPEKFICSVQADRRDIMISRGMDAHLNFDGSTCHDINYLEHVELQINVEYSVRGSLEIYLTSPGGTQVQVLSRRKNDRSRRGFKNWRLMSVFTWNENPQGTWKASVVDGAGASQGVGKVGAFVLILHGLKEKPPYLRKPRGKCLNSCADASGREREMDRGVSKGYAFWERRLREMADGGSLTGRLTEGTEN